MLPSILDYVGLPVPTGVQGRSFRRLAAGGDKRWRNSCFSQLRSGMWLEDGWKLIENSLDGSGSRELYDLKNDPKEEQNLASDLRQRDRVQHCMARMARMRAERPAPPRIPGMAMPAYAQVSEEERREAWRNAPDNREEGAAATQVAARRRGIMAECVELAPKRPERREPHVVHQTVGAALNLPGRAEHGPNAEHPP